MTDLPASGRLDQRLNDRAIAASAVESLLDGDNVRIGGSLAQELQNDVEALERVVDDDVLGADCGETIAREVTDSFREAWRIGAEQEVGAVVGNELLEIGRPQDAVLDHDLLTGNGAVVDVEFVGNERAQVLRHRGVKGEMDRDAAAAAFQRGFVRADEVFSLLLEFDAGIADEAKHTAAFDFVTGEEPIEEQANQVFERQEPNVLAVGVAGQADEPLDGRRQRDECLHTVGVFVAMELEHHHQTHVWDEGEWMRRVDRQRREDGEHAFHEPMVEPRTIGIRK